MLTSSIHGWWTWPSTLTSCKWPQPSWAQMWSCWIPASSANTQHRSNQPRRKRLPKAMGTLKKMNFHTWPGIRTWGKFYSTDKEANTCLFCFPMPNSNCLFRYWGITGGPVLSVWLALDDSLKENGALRVIPGISSALVFCFSFIQLAIKCAF